MKIKLKEHSKAVHSTVSTLIFIQTQESGIWQRSDVLQIIFLKAHPKNRESQKKNGKLRKNICDYYHIPRLMSLIYKELLQINKRVNNSAENWAKGQTFSGRQIEMTFPHRKRRSTLLILSPIRLARTKKKSEETHWRECGEMGTSLIFS